MTTGSELADLAQAGAAVVALEQRERGHKVGTAITAARASSGHLRPSPDRESTVLPRLLTMRQAAEYLAVSYWTVRTWVEHGKLRAVRLPGGGKLLRIERAVLDALIEACRE